MPDDDEVISFPGAQRPARHRWVTDHGLRLSVWEWGAQRRAAVALGARRLRLRRHLRRVRAAARRRRAGGSCPGTSGATATPTTPCSTAGTPTCATRSRCSTATTGEPVPFVGHSKGGGVVMQLADALPAPGAATSSTSTACRRGGAGPTSPTTSARRCSPASSRAGSTTGAGRRRRSASPAPRRAGRSARQRMNPRLPHRVAALPRADRRAREDADGWRWKIDPSCASAASGRGGPSGRCCGMPGLGDAGARRARARGRDDGLGHAARGRRALPARRARGSSPSRTPATSCTSSSPTGVADLVLDFLGDATAASAADGRPRCRHATPAPCARPAATHGRIAPTACTSCAAARPAAAAAARPRRALAGRRCPTTSTRWPGPVWALDFTGHGASTVPRGGGYTAEVLMADADAALAHLGPATVLGRGLGAYVALLLAGARPRAGAGRDPVRRPRHRSAAAMGPVRRS